jgi:NADH-quinone oxidoreductase subunit N|uniref:NADH-quinone oxidoreductase subunit N n=1 Tax=Cephaloticoccus sp. TaxID=1985742 RepID=UPI00404A3729
MNFELLQAAADSNQWSAIFPEIALGLLALALLVFEIVLPKALHKSIPAISIVGQLTLLVCLLFSFNAPYVGTETFNGLLHHTRDGQFLRVFFLLCSIFVSLIATVSLAKQKVPRIEFHHLVLVVSAAMMLLAQSNHFVMLFVALETITVGFYILVSYFRANPLTLEAGLKYLIMGALSSGLLLFGIVLLYGVAGNPLLPDHTVAGMSFPELQKFLAANPHNFLASLGILLVLSGVAFKIGAFPFQIWIPDVYQGAPTPVTAFLAVASKAAGFAVLVTLVTSAFAPYAYLTVPVLTLMAGATLIFGNIAALTQHNVKRLIGLSGVSHAGFLLLGVVAAMSNPSALGAVYFYLFVYLIASFAVFGVMAHVSGANDAEQELDHYSGLAKSHPFLALVLAIGLGSLAGIPPLAGFIGKLFIFIAAFQAGLYPLLAIAVIGVVISIFYYFGWIKAAFFDTWRAPLLEGETDDRPQPTAVQWPLGLALGALAVFTVVLGFYQGCLGDWFLNR